MSEIRLHAVRNAFRLLDTKAKGVIPIEELKTKYNPYNHPRTKIRFSSSEIAASEFEKDIQGYISNGVVTEEAFIKYYTNISSVLPLNKDLYFEELIAQTWNLSQAKEYKAPTRIREIIVMFYEKVCQRTYKDDDEGKAIRKGLKHVDLKDTGTVTIKEFKEFLTLFGCNLKDDETTEFFNFFDEKKTGKINCDLFANYFALMGSGNNPNVKPTFKLESDPPLQTLRKILNTLILRGYNGIRSLNLLFKKLDKNKNHKLDKYEFVWGLRENGHMISEMEFHRLFKYFDRNNDGFIDYQEFLYGLRFKLSELRESLISDMFKALAPSGEIQLEKLAEKFNTESHPKYISGEMSKKDILDEFFTLWEGVPRTQMIKFEDFKEIYADISPCFDRDDNFEKFVKKNWVLSPNQPEQLNVTKENMKESKEIVPAKESDPKKVTFAEGSKLVEKH